VLRIVDKSESFIWRGAKAPHSSLAIESSGYGRSFRTDLKITLKQ
jgi:hypothetical protein